MFLQALVLVAALGDASPTPAPPTATATPVPAISPTPAPTAAPSPSPFAYVLDPPAPAAGRPWVQEIDLTDQTVHPGKPFTIIVSASADVTAVIVEALGQRVPLYVMGGGKFGATWRSVPEIPDNFLNRSYAVTIVASTADGRQTSVPLTVRIAP